jgi:hypothetical protein
MFGKYPQMGTKLSSLPMMFDKEVQIFSVRKTLEMGLINHITWTCCWRTNGNSHWHCQHPYGSGANNWELVNIMTESSRSFQKCYRHWGNRFFWADGILLSAPIVGSWWNRQGIMAGSHIIHSQLHLVLQPIRVLTLCFLSPILLLT